MAALRLVLCTLAIALVTAGARAQAVVASVATPGGTDVAVNPVTNRIYVAGDPSNTVTVIDGATNTATQVAVGLRPQFVAVNTATNRIYASNTRDATLSVIDGVSAMPVGSVTLAFSDAANGRFTATAMGVTQSKPIIRQAFSSPGTVCR